MPHRDKVSALEDRVGALEDRGPQETRLEPVLDIRVGALEVGASKLTRLEPWKSKLVIGKYRLELGRLNIGVFISGWSPTYILLDLLKRRN